MMELGEDNTMDCNTADWPAPHGSIKVCSTRTATFMAVIRVLQGLSLAGMYTDTLDGISALVFLASTIVGGGMIVNVWVKYPNHRWTFRTIASIVYEIGMIVAYFRL